MIYGVKYILRQCGSIGYNNDSKKVSQYALVEVICHRWMVIRLEFYQQKLPKSFFKHFRISKHAPDCPAICGHATCPAANALKECPASAMSLTYVHDHFPTKLQGWCQTHNFSYKLLAKGPWQLMRKLQVTTVTIWQAYLKGTQLARLHSQWCCQSPSGTAGPLGRSGAPRKQWHEVLGKARRERGARELGPGGDPVPRDPRSHGHLHFWSS